MRHKLLILNLLMALAFLPVAQSVVMAATPAEHAHGMMGMDCGQVDPGGHCIDFDCCLSGHHASCDTTAKATPVVHDSVARPGSQFYFPDPLERLPSHHPELLLRPPRKA